MPAYGRGGVGNIQAVAQEQERRATDLEANASVQESGTSSDALSISQGPSQQYRHAGRGGAGNYETVAETNEQHSKNDVTGGEPVQSTTTRTAGRGGAGNHDFAAATASKSATREQLEEDLTRKIINQKVEENVDQYLPMPQQAKIAHSRSLNEK